MPFYLPYINLVVVFYLIYLIFFYINKIKFDIIKIIMKSNKKKIYPKRKLADLIIEYNSDAFIPREILLADLDTIYRIRKTVKKIMKNSKHDLILLRNMVITTKNVFGSSCFYIYNKVMTDEELEVLSNALSKISQL